MAERTGELSGVPTVDDFGQAGREQDESISPLDVLFEEPAGSFDEPSCGEGRHLGGDSNDVSL